MKNTSKQLLKKLTKIRAGYIKKFNIHPTSEWHFLKIQEEVGEMTQAFLKLNGQARTQNENPKELKKKLGNEMADVICMTLLAAEKMRIDIDKAVERKWFRHLKN